MTCPILSSRPHGIFRSDRITLRVPCAQASCPVGTLRISPPRFCGVARANGVRCSPIHRPVQHIRCNIPKFREYGRFITSICASTASTIESASSDGKDNATSFIRVVLPCALALLLCNMDRICMSVAILPISREFGWSPEVVGIIQSSFLWGYTATQLIGGTLADKLGGKRVMGYGILWFSLSSLLLPMALSEPIQAAGLALPAVLFARTMVGLGEGVALPSMNNLVATHIQRERKATALGGAFTGFHAGNLVGLMLSPLIIATFGWRRLFIVFGLLGVPLLLFWNKAVLDPAKSQAGSSAERGTAAGKEGEKGPGVGDLIRSKHTWAIVVANCVNHWGYFLYLNWLPAYFYSVLKLDLKSSSLFSFLPWLAMAVGSSAAGIIADGLVRRGVPVTNVRRGIQAVAFLVPACALFVLVQMGASISPAAAVGLLVVVLGLQSLGQAGFVANMSDIAPTAAGKMFGLCNTFGSLSGIASAIVAGKIMEATGSFNPMFQVTIGLYLLGTISWLALCTGERQF